MNEQSLEFDMNDADSCMKRWTFTLQESNDRTVIKSVMIKPSSEGCDSHPKTIMALVRNTPVQALDVDNLSRTRCVRT